ncbi:conserved Plasmodium protein, unknown function [Plasmodium malariae]|uniref:TOG domain-containing protein n=1 Tax=Plasmodium malariae TaxID=5858 RepID=A0A1A8WAF6_PLAMA|nr:conserved Plasmodium protein, unknown function [Plasmodium malariae]
MMVSTMRDSVEACLPENITKLLISNSYSSKIEALHLLSEWAKEEANFMSINLENLVLLIKKNCYDFKGKYNQLNSVLYDFFNDFIDLCDHFNIVHLNNNTQFTKILTILICLYLDKATDKKDGTICFNFLYKCFQYFDNNMVIDLLIKNSDTKNAKKCEECIKILQKVFLTKNTNSNVNIKNLIYFLKKFVDSKNTNLKNASILMLQILSKNFGDKYVLSYLEGIAENVRQVVKLKEDVDKFVQKQGIIANSLGSFVRNVDNKYSSSVSNNVNMRAVEKVKKEEVQLGNIHSNLPEVDAHLNTQVNAKTNIHSNYQTNHYEVEEKNAYLSYSGDNLSPFHGTNPNDQKRVHEDLTKINLKLSDPLVKVQNNTLIEGDCSVNTFSIYNNTRGDTYQEKLTRLVMKEEEQEDNVKHFTNRDQSTVESRTKLLRTKKEQTQSEYKRDEEEEDEKMINISDIIKQYVIHIMDENGATSDTTAACISLNSQNNGMGSAPNNVANNTSNNTSKIISTIEKIGKYYINPDRLDILINHNMLHKIYSSNKSKCMQLLYVLLFSLRENTDIYADILFEFVVKIIDDADITVEQIDKLLTCMCKNLGISKFISQINSYMLSEKLRNMKKEGGSNSHNNGSRSDLVGGNSHLISGINKRPSKRNKMLIVMNNINTNHILLLNENVIRKKVLKFYLDLFMDDNEQVREKSSIVLDHIYSKYGGNIFFNIYEKLSVHKKECLHDILNQMKSNKEEFSFYKIIVSNNTQIKRLSNNESNLSSTTPTMSRSRSIKRLSSFSNKNKMLKIEFPSNYKIKPDKLKWEKNLDHTHSNYLMKEFKSFSSQELTTLMFSENVNMINRSILFFKDYLSNSSNQTILFSKSGFMDLLLKWAFFILNGNQNNNELLCASINLIRIILKTIEDNYSVLNEQTLIILVNFTFDKINSTATSSEIRKKLREILICLCYISDHKVYFALLLKNLSSCSQKRICSSLDIILKLIILYKEKCLNIEKDIMKILQVFTVHSKNKNVTVYCLKIFANIQYFCPNFYKCIDNDDISYYLKSKVDEFIEKCPDTKITFKDGEDDENNSSYQSENSEGRLIALNISLNVATQIFQ